jgi:hypothetical protein
MIKIKLFIIFLFFSLTTILNSSPKMDIKSAILMDYDSGKILYEVAGIPEKDAIRAFELAGAKLPMSTTFVKRGSNG